MVSRHSAVGWSCLLASALADSSSLVSPEQRSRQCHDSACHLDDAMPLLQVQAGVKELFVSSADQAGAVPYQVDNFAATNSPTNVSTSVYLTRYLGAMPRFLDRAVFPTVVFICVVFLSLLIYWRKTWTHIGCVAAEGTFGLEPRQFVQIPHWQQQLIHFNVPFSSCVRNKPR